MNTTRHRGSPPHRSNRALDSPHDKDESVARTTLGPGYDRSSSRTDVTKRTGASWMLRVWRRKEGGRNEKDKEEKKEKGMR